jgi:hypothetical protein
MSVKDGSTHVATLDRNTGLIRQGAMQSGADLAQVLRWDIPSRVWDYRLGRLQHNLAKQPSHRVSDNNTRVLHQPNDRRDRL